MKERLFFTLIDNALDYLLSAAEHARADERRSWKYAVLHLTAGVELLVKARLEREHWSLLFADVDKAAQSALESGDFRSVDFETACNRLENIATVTIDEPTVRHLDQLWKLRNRVQHFAVDVELEQVKSLLANGTNFFIGFLRSNLADEMGTREKKVEAIHEQLREFEEFVQARLASVKDDLVGVPDVVECPRCWQETVAIGRGDPSCAFCGFTASPREMRDMVGEGPVDEACLNCEQRTLSFVLYHNEFGVDYCMSCGTRQTMCLNCRHRSIGENSVCPSCGYSG